MLQVFIQSVKALMIVAIVVLCYEAFMQVGWSFTWIEMSMNENFLQGSEANWEKVTAAGKEDLVALGNIAMVKMKQLAVIIMEKREDAGK